MKGCKLCQHTKDDGKLCGSPAMRGKRYCYFHLEVIRRRKRLANIAWFRSLLVDPNLNDDKVLGLIRYAHNILTAYFHVTSSPSRICAGEGRGVPADAAAGPSHSKAGVLESVPNP